MRTQSIEVKPPPTVTTRLPTQTSCLPEVDVLQELEAGDDAFQVLARDAEFLRNLAPGGDDDRVVDVGKLGEHHIATDLGVVLDLDAEIGDEADLVHDDVAGETPLWHPGPHDAARHRVALVDGDLIALAGQVAGRGETVGAGADDGGGEAVRGRWHFAAGFAAVIGGDPLEVADADGSVDFLAAAGVFAGAGAHAAQAAGENVVLAVELEGVGVAAVGDEGDVAGDVGVRGAGGHAGDVVLEPLRIAGVDGQAGTVSLDEVGVERGVDEGQEADAAGVIDLDIVVALTGDAVVRHGPSDGVDLGRVHGPEAVSGRAAGDADIGRASRRRGSIRRTCIGTWVLLPLELDVNTRRSVNQPTCGPLRSSIPASRCTRCATS